MRDLKVPCGPILLAGAILVGLTTSAKAGWVLNRTFGGLGTGGGLFNGAVNIDVDSRDRSIILDQGNNKVQIFGPNGYFLREFGSGGSALTQFNAPVSVAVTPSDEIAVLDGRNSKIKIFSQTGQFLRSFGNSGFGPGKLGNMINMDISSQGMFALTNQANRVDLYDAAGNYMRSIEPIIFVPGTRATTYDVEFLDANTVAISTGPEPRVGVQFFNTQGQFLYAIEGSRDGKLDLNGSGRNNDPGEWDFPWSIAFNDANQLAVAHSYEQPVSLYDMQGEFLEYIGDRPKPDHLRVNYTIQFNSRGHLIRVDRDNNTVNIYRPISGTRVAGVQAVPEPSSIALVGLGVGLLCGGGALRRQRHQRASLSQT